MIYLGLALYAEGPTDYRFLCPLLQRVSEELALEARTQVDVSQVLPLDAPVKYRSRAREERITVAAALAAPQWRVLFIHADGAGDPDRMRAEQVEPALASLDTSGAIRAGCAVIPVRETEAWALCDPEAYRASVAKDLVRRLHGRRGARRVEAEEDPKARLHEILNAGSKPSARKGKTARDVTLADLGDRVSLERLRELPSFRRFEGEFRETLTRIGVLR